MGGEWKELTLAQLGRIVTGKTPSSKGDDSFGGTIPFVTPTDFDGRRVITDTSRYLTEKGASSVAGSRIPSHAVMVTCIGSDMGKAAIAGRDCVTNQQINSILVSNEYEPLFVYYNLSSRQPEIRSYASGSAQPILNKSDFGTLAIRIPPLREQQAIACILGALDDKIELNRKMNKTLEEMARAIFKSWFVDFDPVRAKAAVRRAHPGWTNEQVSRAACPKLKPEIAELFPDSFENSELGEIPKGWRVQSFTDDVEVIGGGTPRTSNPEYWDGEILWFSVVDTPAVGEVFVICTEKTITQHGLDNSSTRVLPVGTTIISARGTVGNLALVGVPMAMNQSCYGLHDSRGNNGYFLYFSTAAVVESLRQRTHGSVFNTITRDTLKSIRVVTPPNAFIFEYERVVGAMLKRILSALHESRTLAAMRDTLLPKLISGELRIKDAEEIVGRAL